MDGHEASSILNSSYRIMLQEHANANKMPGGQVKPQGHKKKETLSILECY